MENEDLEVYILEIHGVEVLVRDEEDKNKLLKRFPNNIRKMSDVLVDDEDTLNEWLDGEPILSIWQPDD